MQTNVRILLTNRFALWYNANVSEKIQAKCPYRWKKREVESVPIALCSLRLFGYMALTDWIGWRRIGRKSGILKKQKTVPEQVGFRFSPALLYSVAQILASLRRRVVKNNCFVALWPEWKLSSRRQLSLCITSGFCCRLRWNNLLPPLLMLRFLA